MKENKGQSSHQSQTKTKRKVSKQEKKQVCRKISAKLTNRPALVDKTGQIHAQSRFSVRLTSGQSVVIQEHSKVLEWF